MNAFRTRRDFLSSVGQGMVVATIGAHVAADLSLTTAHAADEADENERLAFGSLEPLVVLMQETPIEKLLPTLVDHVQKGTELKTLVAAAALANARTFGGEDYVGYHTLMALAPAWRMALEASGPRQALPIFKVLYRNTERIIQHGGRPSEVLRRPVPASIESADDRIQQLRAAVAARDVERAERTFAAIAQKEPREAFDELLYTVQEDTQVHRTVLPHRAWELLGIVGTEHAHTLLRQSVRFCVKEQPHGEPSKVLVKALDEHQLLGRKPGDRPAEDAWIEAMCQTIFKSSPEQSADAVAAALAEGFAPGAIGEALALAANQLVLRDPGRSARQEILGKPIGSVHGDSVGVHASDSANAWRNMADVGSVRNLFACLILGAYQAAQDRMQGGGDYLNLAPLPLDLPWKRLTMTEPEKLLAELDAAIHANLQAHACNVVQRYGQLGYDAQRVFDLLRQYAVSEDGALHAEKFYCTTSEEFSRTRPAFRWRHVVALARVTASEYGRPAPGYQQSCELLKLS